MHLETLSLMQRVRKTITLKYLTLDSCLRRPNSSEEAEHQFSVSLALSAIYVISLVIEIYGIIGVSLVRFPLHVSVFIPLNTFSL